VKLILRILLLLVMGRLAYLTAIDYAFAFAQGYPLAPLLGLALCFWAYVRLGPTCERTSQVVYNGRSIDSFLFFCLAVISSVFLLQLRKEIPYTPPWFFHVVALTSFQFLVPRIAARAFAKAELIVSTVTALLLLFILWKGTEMRHPGSVSMNSDNPGIHDRTMLVMPAAENQQFRPQPASLKLDARSQRLPRSI